MTVTPIPARRRAKGATIQGFYTVTPPPTEEQVARVTSLVERYPAEPPLTDPERERILDALFAEPTTYSETASYHESLAVRRERRKQKRETRLKEAA